MIKSKLAGRSAPADGRMLRSHCPVTQLAKGYGT